MKSKINSEYDVHVVTLHGLLPVKALDKVSQNCHEAYTEGQHPEVIHLIFVRR
jgi:hypothetical protein